MVSLLKQINISSHTWYAIIDMPNAFFLILVSKDCQKQFALSCYQQHTFTVLSWGYICSHLYHNLVHKDLDHLFLPQDIVLVNHIDGVMLIGPSKQDVAITLDFLIRCLYVRGWDINTTKIQGPFTSGKFLRVQPWETH